MDVANLQTTHPVKYSLFDGDHVSTGMAGGDSLTYPMDQVYIEFDFAREYVISRFVIEGIQETTNECDKTAPDTSTINYCNSNYGREYAI